MKKISEIQSQLATVELLSTNDLTSIKGGFFFFFDDKRRPRPGGGTTTTSPSCR